MAIKFQKTEQETTPKTYKVGDTFLKENEIPYMLTCDEGNTICLTNMTTGDTFREAVKVINVDNITEFEFNRIVDCNNQIFTPCDFILTIKNKS